MRHAVIVAIGALSALGGAGLGKTLSQERIELSRPAVGASSPLDEGNHGFFRIAVEPAAIQVNGSLQALEYRVRLDSAFPKPARAALAIEVVDDQGRPAQRAERPGLRTVAPGGQQHLTFTTPAGLRDGYYQVRVTAALADGEYDQLEISERYFRVERGSVSPISSEEWFQQSAANVAVPL
jgi:hypothetical protein